MYDLNGVCIVKFPNQSNSKLMSKLLADNNKGGVIYSYGEGDISLKMLSRANAYNLLSRYAEYFVE